jgi:monoamine oxidase
MGLVPTYSDPFYGRPVPSAGSGDYRIIEGYGSLHDDLASGLDVRLEQIVRAIDWSEKPIRVVLDSGAVPTADHVLITLPLAVLKAGRVQFTPPLPAWKQEAIDRLQMGPALKLVYRFDRPIAPRGTTALYSDGQPPMWWTPQHQADGEQVWLALATGDWARELLALGEQGAIARGLDTLRREFGQPDLTPVEARLVNWAADEFALGGYSTVPPGADGQREVLAQPVSGESGDVLFFAGEATAPNPYASMVHGAYLTGRRAAREILSSR